MASIATAAIFQEIANPGRYDLTINGRGFDYGLTPDEFADAIRRARIKADVPIWVEHADGRREKFTVR